MKRRCNRRKMPFDTVLRPTVFLRKYRESPEKATRSNTEIRGSSIQPSSCLLGVVLIISVAQTVLPSVTKTHTRVKKDETSK